jgi:hypothetical protein
MKKRGRPRLTEDQLIENEERINQDHWVSIGTASEKLLERLQKHHHNADSTRDDEPRTSSPENHTREKRRTI